MTNACGTAAKTYVYSATAYSGTYCYVGNPTPASPAFPTAGSSTTWTCPVVNGDPVSCTAIHTGASTSGSCGSANGTNVYSAPSTNLCSQGTASTVTASSYSWTWAFVGANGGSTASCSANRKVDGVCGGTGPYASLSTGLCSAGTSANLSGSGPWTWNCYGINSGTTASCSATYGHTSCAGLPGDMNYGGSIPGGNGAMYCAACGSSGSAPSGWRFYGNSGAGSPACGMNVWSYFY